jgi:FkbM family methyltransferase
MYAVTHGTFRTPRGRSVTMAYREDTSDYNTLRSCMNEDEYRLRDLNLSGTALDVGAHIGGVAVALALDNPELRIIAVEAVPPNVELLRENVNRAGVSDRVAVVPAAAGKGKTTTIKWGFAGNESADHHAFIGNSLLPPKSEHLSEKVKVRTLADLVAEYGPISFAKVDCEMCEFAFLRGAALSEVALIRGEVHADPTELVDALAPTHDVTFPAQIPGPFEAVRL